MELHTTQWESTSGWRHPLARWDDRRTLVLAFGAPGLAERSEAIDELVATYPGSTIVGCSTAGEIWGDTVADGTLTVATARFAATEFRLVHDTVARPEDSYGVGQRMGARLETEVEDLKAVFVLSDGLTVNGDALVAGLLAGTGGRVIITGGLAGDGERFERSWVIVDGRPTSGVVTAVGIAGAAVGVGHGSRGGWDIFGPERRITRSAGNVLFELDGQPALALYKNYLGERAAGLPATALLFPLSVKAVGPQAHAVVRTILAVDEQAQSMTFAGDVPQGATAQLMRANVDRLIDGAHRAAVEADKATHGPTLAVAISCVGRRLLLGQRSEDELEATKAGLPAGTELVGFYSYGEISPVDSGACELHNQTMTLTTLWETSW